MDNDVRQCLFNISDRIDKLEKRVESVEENSGKIHLEVGKLYRTRDHQKAFVSAYDANGTKYKYIGIVVGDSGTTTWKANGCFDNEGSRCARDIIGEWEK